jgi:UDP-N-acetylglucosamine 2-epimerase (non-hydrolysing)
MAKIIGMSRDAIVNETSHLLDDATAYQDMSEGANPFGDGHSSERIVEAVARWHQKKTPLLEADKQFKLAPRPLPRRRKSDSEETASKAAAAGKE